MKWNQCKREKREGKNMDSYSWSKYDTNKEEKKFGSQEKAGANNDTNYIEGEREVQKRHLVAKRKRGRERGRKRGFRQLAYY